MRILVSGSTVTLRRLAPLWPDHLGALLTPGHWGRVEPLVKLSLPWGVDNGAFSGFDPVSFSRLLRRVAGQPNLAWIVAPDVVGDAHATLALFLEWFDEITRAGPVAYVAQDGSEACPPPWPFIDCLFLGGTTRFKLSQCAADLAGKARGEGKWVHMGRVNSRKRLRAAYDMGCDSVDGSGYSWFAETHLPRHLAFIRGLEPQPVMFG